MSRRKRCSKCPGADPTLPLRSSAEISFRLANTGTEPSHIFIFHPLRHNTQHDKKFISLSAHSLARPTDPSPLLLPVTAPVCRPLRALPAAHTPSTSLGYSHACMHTSLAMYPTSVPAPNNAHYYYNNMTTPTTTTVALRCLSLTAAGRPEIRISSPVYRH